MTVAEVSVEAGVARSYDFDPRLFGVEVFGSGDRRPLSAVYTYDPLFVRAYDAPQSGPELDLQRLEYHSPELDGPNPRLGPAIRVFNTNEGNRVDGEVYGSVVNPPIYAPNSASSGNPGVGMGAAATVMSSEDVISASGAPSPIPRERLVRVTDNVVTYFLPFDGRAEYILASYQDESSASERYEVRDVVAGFCQEHPEVKSCRR